mgnify:CR=1 FL=1
MQLMELLEEGECDLVRLAGALALFGVLFLIAFEGKLSKRKAFLLFFGRVCAALFGLDTRWAKALSFKLLQSVFAARCLDRPLGGLPRAIERFVGK